MSDVNSQSVIESLRRSSKGRLTYDRDWDREGRAQEIISDVRHRLTALTISPLKSTPEEQEAPENEAKPLKVSESRRDANDSIQKKERSNESIFDSVHLTNLTRTESETEGFLLDYEQERMAKIRTQIEFHANDIYNNFRESQEEAEEEMRRIREKHRQTAMNRINAYKENADNILAEISGKKSAPNKRDNNNILKDIETKQRQRLLEKEKKEVQLILMRYNSIKLIHNYCIKEAIASNDPQYPPLQRNALAAIISYLEELMAKEAPTDEDVASAEGFRSQVDTIRCQAEDVIRIKTAGNIKQQHLPHHQTPQQHTRNDPQGMQKGNQAHAQASGSAVITPENRAPARRPVSIEDRETKIFTEYFKLQQFSSEFEKSIEEFATEPTLKPYKTSLQQFVRTTINAISSGSTDHLKQKYQRLAALFDGNSIEFQGKRVHCKGHPSALNFCLHWAAKTFISVGTKQVLSVPKAAFPMGAVIVLLWSRFPVFGKLFMSQIQEKCPYIGAYYPKREEGDPEVSHLIACGYVYGSDGESLESEESFLNRMRALIRMYGAVIQSNLMQEHPHSISYGWSWLSSILNAEPRPGVTAAAIHAFLTVTVQKLFTVYGKQTLKLLNFILAVYVPRIERNSEKEVRKQSIVQLKMYIEDVLKKWKRNPSSIRPEGVLPDFFWQKSYLSSGTF